MRHKPSTSLAAAPPPPPPFARPLPLPLRAKTRRGGAGAAANRRTGSVSSFVSGTHTESASGANPVVDDSYRMVLRHQEADIETVDGSRFFGPQGHLFQLEVRERIPVFAHKLGVPSGREAEIGVESRRPPNSSGAG
ncbi:hypothetical protein BDY21DRAFT_423479 [Lineolata rhizophorae]|uniref:Uncharacterized protein n=1 Tax=Lineolata rhizophorae TaxID=578093 RepID=A0A6A6NT99_9PEZI|nr:hypothetical protein BDY21DRAFT_423479 [Lineolata rhizophorae]